jgi:hypothetical protein
MDRKGFIEKLADWTIAIQKRLEGGENILNMAGEIDTMEALLATTEGLTIRKRTIPLDKAAFNEWAQTPTFPPDKNRDIIGRGDVRHLPGVIPEHRATTYTSNDNDNDGGGTRYVNARGQEVRTFNRGESYAAHIGAEPFSLGKLLRGMAIGSWHDAEHEKRLMTVVSDTAGGFLLTPEMSAQVIDLARNKSSVFRAGVRFAPMQTNELVLAKLTQDPTSEWVGETNGITASDASFGQVILRAKTLACLAGVSIPLLEDAANAPAVIETRLRSNGTERFYEASAAASRR